MQQDAPAPARAPQPPPRHRPLLPVVVGFALGIALGAALSPPLWACWALAGASLAGALWAVRRGLEPWGNWVLALILLAACGGLWHEVRLRRPDARHLRSLPLRGGQIYRLRGEVAREPLVHVRRHPFGAGEGAGARYWGMRLAVRSIGAGGSWRPARGGVTVFGDGDPPALGVGDRIELVGRPRLNRPATNPGERDLALAYERDGSYGTVRLTSPEALTVRERAAWHSSPGAAVGRLRTAIRRRLAAALERREAGREFGLIAALLLGQRHALSEEQEDLLKESGTLHFLAISGLHVGLFALSLHYLLALAGLPVRLRTACTVALLWGYVLMTGMHVSAVRAGWMLTILLAAPVLGRRRDSLSALLGAALAILVLAPGQLFEPGFQLTFVAVWAMICIYLQLAGVLWPWEDFLAQVRDPAERSLWADLWRLGRSYLALSCVVWAATAPIRAYHFHSLCFLAPLLNLVMWPLVIFLLFGSMLLALVLLVAAPLAGPLVGWVVVMSEAIGELLRLASGAPGFGVYMPAPPAWWVALFYAALGVWIVRDRLPAGRRVVVGAAAALAVGLVAGAVVARVDRPFRLVVADVGSGQAAFACAPGGQVVLFDAGSQHVAGRRAVADALWHYGIDSVDAAVVSDLSSDHCAFLPYLHRRFGIAELAVPAAVRLTPLAARVRAWARRQEMPVQPLKEGLEVRGGGLRCTVLHPDDRFAADPHLDLNDRCLVLHCRYGPVSFLLPGDVQTAALRRLSEDHGDRLRADVLLMPHHGHWHDGLAEFVDRVRPEAVLVSGGEEDLHPETAELLRSRGLDPWVTGREGAIILTVRPEGATLRGHHSGRSATLGAGPTRGVQP